MNGEILDKKKLNKNNKLSYSGSTRLFMDKQVYVDVQLMQCLKL
jgi:hypothetical protein